MVWNILSKGNIVSSSRNIFLILGNQSFRNKWGNNLQEEPQRKINIESTKNVQLASIPIEQYSKSRANMKTSRAKSNQDIASFMVLS